MDRISEYGYYWPNGICIPGLRSIFVATDGQYFPCERMNTHSPFTIGNIDDGYDINKVVNIIDEYAEKSLSLCENCWAYRFCSTCFMSWPNDNNRKSKSCENVKKYFFRLFQAYIDIVRDASDAFDYLDTEGNDIIVNDMRLD